MKFMEAVYGKRIKLDLTHFNLQFHIWHVALVQRALLWWHEIKQVVAKILLKLIKKKKE